jgi:hypothetical protein
MSKPYYATNGLEIGEAVAFFTRNIARSNHLILQQLDRRFARLCVVSGGSGLL